MRIIKFVPILYFLIINLFIVLLLSSCSEKEKLKVNWEPDLQYAKQEMQQNEIALKINDDLAKTFSTQMDRIIKDLPKYKSDDQVKIDLSKALASIEQVHTKLEYENENVLPFIIYLYNEKLYVVNTLPQYSNILFAELTEINHQPVAKIMETLKDVVSVDNEQGLLVEIPSHLVRYSILHGLGIVDEDQDNIPVSFLLEDHTKINSSVPWVYQGDTSLRLINPNKDDLLYKKLRDSNYTYTYLAEDNTLYAAYNSCSEDPNYSMEQYSDDIVQTINNFPVGKLIIDLRNNRGGNSEVIQPLLEKLSNIPKIQHRIVVLMGRYSASSAMSAAIELRSRLNATLMGEPVNGDPNKPGDIRSFKLDESGLNIIYSTKEFHMLDTKDKGLNPDVYVNTTIEDLRKGIDPVMEQAIKY